jgi:hypothetical protein
MVKKKKGQTMVYKKIPRKLKIEQYEPHYKPGMNSGAQQGVIRFLLC